jgi:flagellar assembly protein FliH
MALLRQANATTAARDAVPLNLADVEREAEAIRQKARDDAAEIIKDARRQREQLTADAEQIGHEEGHQKGHAEGLEKGHAEGLQQGREEAAADLNALAKRWTDALAEIDARRTQLEEHARTDLLRLALDIAERITKASINANPNAAADQLAAAVQLVLDTSRLRIETHPDDADACRDALPTIANAVENNHAVRLTENPDLDPGSVLLHTTHGTVDASIETQLEAITTALLGQSRKDNTPETTDTPNPQPQPEPEHDQHHEPTEHDEPRPDPHADESTDP